jgi:hypothetical protein
MFWWLRENIPPDGYMHDAAVESFVLHLRNLIDFFYPRRSVQDSDVIATDFMDDPAAWDPPTSISAPLAAARTRGRGRDALFRVQQGIVPSMEDLAGQGWLQARSAGQRRSFAPTSPADASPKSCNLNPLRSTQRWRRDL